MAGALWARLHHLSRAPERQRQRQRAQRVQERVQLVRASRGGRSRRLRPTDVAAVLVTRGDVDLEPIKATLPYGEIVVWDNSRREQAYAYGRYLAIAETQAPVIYFQDDDCLVLDHERLLAEYEPGLITANMPLERTDYIDTVLLGWGSLFDRNLPEQAFSRWQAAGYEVESEEFQRIGADFIFPMLTPWKRVDVGHQNLPWARDQNRTFRQPGYVKIKRRFIRKARSLADDLPLVDAVENEATRVVNISVRGRSYYAAIPLEDQMADAMAEGRPYEEDLLTALATLLEPDDLVIDCEANIGNHSLYFASVCAGKVEAYEPNPVASAFLRRSVALNDFGSQIRVHRRAVDISSGRGSSTSPPATKLGAARIVPGEGDVVICPLDASPPDTPVALLKVDVEGRQVDVIRGALGLLARDHPVIAVKTHKEGDCSEVDALLRPLGYSRFPVVFAHTDTHIYLTRSSQYWRLWCSRPVLVRLVKPRWLLSAVTRWRSKT